MYSGSAFPLLLVAIFLNFILGILLQPMGTRVGHCEGTLEGSMQNRQESLQRRDHSIILWDGEHCQLQQIFILLFHPGCRAAAA